MTPIRRRPVYTSVAFAAIAALALVGCSDDSGGSDAPTGTTPIATTSTVSPAAGGADPGPAAGGGAPGNGGASGAAPSNGGSNSGDGSQNGPGEGNTVNR